MTRSPIELFWTAKNINLSQIETESGPDSAVGNSNKNPLISSLHKEKEESKDKGEGKDKSHLKGKVEGKHSDLLKEQPLLTRNSSLKKSPGKGEDYGVIWTPVGTKSKIPVCKGDHNFA